MPQYGHQVPGVHHQAVGILDKNLAAAVPRPVPGRGPGPGIASGRGHQCRRPGSLPEVLHRLVHRVDVPQNMGHRPDREPGAFIDRAEGAVVPGTVPGHPQQEAVRLAGGPDGSLLKAFVGHIPAVGPLWHSLNSLMELYHTNDTFFRHTTKNEKIAGAGGVAVPGRHTGWRAGTPRPTARKPAPMRHFQIRPPKDPFFVILSRAKNSAFKAREILHSAALRSE